MRVGKLKRSIRIVVFSNMLFVAVTALEGRSVFAAGPSNAPHQINFSGYLTNGGGAPVTNSAQDMKFGIYINGTRVWCADYNAVNVSNGQFSVVLGANGAQGGVSYDAATCTTPSGTLAISSTLISSVTASTPVMLEMLVWNGSGYDVLAPQFPISSALFALQAESVGGYAASQLAKQDGSGNIISSTQQYSCDRSQRQRDRPDGDDAGNCGSCHASRKRHYLF